MKYSKVRYPENMDIDLENHIPKNSNIEGFEDWVTIASIQNEVILKKVTCQTCRV